VSLALNDLSFDSIPPCCEVFVDIAIISDSLIAVRSAINNPDRNKGKSVSWDRLSVLSGMLLGGMGLGPYHRLGPLNLTQHLDEGEFIQLLNDRRKTNAANSGLLPLMPVFPSVPEIIREWIDEWLYSGRDPGGVEKSAERHFTEGSKASLAAYEYSKRNRIGLLGISGSLEVWFSPYETDNGRPRLLGVRNEDIAREKLVFFLLSEFRFKLAKCRKEGCGKYFALKHWKRTYKRGTVCADCQRIRSQESAAKATSGDRIQAEWMLSRLAAKKFSKQILRNPNWVNDRHLRESLVKYLNTQIERVDLLRAVYLSGPRNGITGKWLSRAKNWKSIEMI